MATGSWQREPSNAAHFNATQARLTRRTTALISFTIHGRLCVLFFLSPYIAQWVGRVNHSNYVLVDQAASRRRASAAIVPASSRNLVLTISCLASSRQRARWASVASGTRPANTLGLVQFITKTWALRMSSDEASCREFPNAARLTFSPS